MPSWKCYGRKPTKTDYRTLRLGAYKAAPQLNFPPACDWTAAVPAWPAYLNTQIGDCTIAAAAHLIQLWSANAGEPLVPTDQQCLSAYTDVSGYDPATGANDNGAAELDVLNYWRATGIAGNKITTYVALDPSNFDELKYACAMFGGVYIGITVPQSAETQFDAGQPWSNVWLGGPIVGRHAIPIVAYDANTFTVITWGAKQVVEPDFLVRHLEEAYAVLDTDWLTAAGNSPSGLNLSQLEADVAALGQ
jgi:hypothetical protein